MNAGYEFLGTVIASGLVGYGIDRYFDTTPWGMIILLVLGFVTATYKAQKKLNKKD
ncbi:MAG: AtpZ/AtpI family protein [Rhodospirillales bacterium]|nr:AtpZ/AtpI family protein [Rhodospirillales bacterium]